MISQKFKTQFVYSLLTITSFLGCDDRLTSSDTVPGTNSENSSTENPWVRFESKEGEFEVSFPKHPIVSVLPKPYLSDTPRPKVECALDDGEFILQVAYTLSAKQAEDLASQGDEPFWKMLERAKARENWTPPSKETVRQQLDVMQERVVRQFSGVLVRASDLQINNFIGREIVITCEFTGRNGKVQSIIYYRALVGKERVYILFAGGNQNRVDLSVVSRFLDSFKPLGTAIE